MLMKNLILYISVLLLLIGCNRNAITPSVHIVRTDVDIANFSSIQVHGRFNLYITMSNENRVVIETNDNVLPSIECYTMADNTLVLDLKRGTSFRREPTLNIYVSAINLYDIIGLNRANILLENLFIGNTLNIELSGDVYFEGKVKVNMLTAKMSNGSMMRIAGNANRAVFHSSGESVLYGYNLINKDCDIGIGENGYAEIYVTNKLFVDARSFCTLYYKGYPYTQIYAPDDAIIEPYY